MTPILAPTVGRIVHYQSYGSPGGEYKSIPRAAIVTETPGIYVDDSVGIGLAILNPTGMFFTANVKHSETPKPGCWSWPPKV